MGIGLPVSRPWLASLFLTLLAVFVMVPAPRAAAVPPAPAMTRCTEQQVPNRDIPEVVVQGNGGGSEPAGANPSNVLEPGDVFVIIPEPESRVSVSRLGENYGPDGTGRVADGSWPYPGLSQYSAVLRFNNNPGGWVDSPVQATAFQQCTRWDRSLPVRLLFGVNDPKLDDNGGMWKFRVQIYKASVSATNAMDRCSRRAPASSPGDRDELVSVWGKEAGSFPSGPNPGNVLAQGDVVRIIPDLRSTITIDYWKNWVYPNGNLLAAPPSGWPYPELFQFSAVLRFNNNPGGWVGPPAQATAFGGCMTWTDSRPVRLLFGVNDPDVSDNSSSQYPGAPSWKFRVLVYKS
ncbi:hypothetical protein [Streptomyces echinatus]|uniref:hypothetical protein n=1 Tax=Streptomyces echinatus TaxID=67293 RepID=UPI0037950069